MKPLILGLDIATRTGWALWDSSKDYSSIQCGTFQLPPGKEVNPAYRADQIGLKITNFARRAKEAYGRPIDIIVIEEAAHTSLGGITSTINSCMIHGGVYATLSNHGLLWGTVHVATWRASFFGRGFKPRFKVTKLEKADRHGKMEKVEYFWKEAAINRCDEMGISLPSTKAEQEDAAEAVGVAICWHKVKVHAERYEKRLTTLLQSRNDRARVAA